MIHRLLGTLILLGCVGAAAACPPVAFRSYGYSYATSYATPYVAPAVATYSYPAYFVAYGGNGNAELLSEVRLLKAQVQIESLKTQLLLSQQAQNGGGVNPFGQQKNGAEAVPAPKADEQVRAVFQSCAECHSNGTAKGKLQMFAGNNFAKLTADQMGACFQRVLDGSMPPKDKGALNSDQKIAVLTGLTKWPTQ